MAELLHTGHEPLIGELIFMAAGFVVAIVLIWYGVSTSRRLDRHRRRRGSLGDDTD